ncbi:MAG: TIGR03621 family F420-dependent LLM class oxidoreductase [Acidimicrobiales bacterium]
MTRRFRFGVSTGHAPDRSTWHDRARLAESAGFDVLLIADHLVPSLFPPMIALQSAADATERLHVGTFVLNNDFRHPVLVAREAAALEALTDGRFELGIGAGHMKFEYDQAGIAFDDAATRVARLAEAIEVMRQLWSGEPCAFSGEHYHVTDHKIDATQVPLLVGGNGPRLLRLAAERADIIGFTGFSPNADGSGVRLEQFTSQGLEQRVALVRDAAGDRFDSLELNALLQVVQVTGDRRAAAEAVAARVELAVDDILDSPFVLLGTHEQMAEQLLQHRERFGVSYWVMFGERPGSDQTMSTIAPVIERLAGR